MYIFKNIEEAQQLLNSIVSDKSNDSILKHQATLSELHYIYKAKNADYGDSFHETFEEEGLAMARIRLTDKLNRFKHLTQDAKAHVEDESVIDTLLDLANYAVMTIMELTDWKDEKE